MPTEIMCGDCGARVPDVDGPTHRYLGAAPGCWAAYNQLLLRQYGDPASYAGLQQMTVDSYAAQHPGIPSPQTCQSVAVHLLSLCLVLERGWAADRTIAPMRAFLAAHKGTLPWLPPPPTLGPLTVLDALHAPTPAAYHEVIRAWACSVWTAWTAAHGAIVRGWADELKHR